MDMTVLLAAICFAFIIISVAEAIHGDENPVWRGVSRMTAGVLLLYALNVTAPFTGIKAPISVLSIAVSSMLGIPGAFLIVFLNAYFL